MNARREITDSELIALADRIRAWSYRAPLNRDGLMNARLATLELLDAQDHSGLHSGLRHACTARAYRIWKVSTEQTI